MPLESLLEQVETLRNRAETHRDALQASEALTRYALIDPLLRELGWDTADPAMVMPEYRSGSGSADYALLNDGSPAMMVEAKKLGTPLQDAVVAQGINYCLMEGTRHFAVTDGARWDIYETHKPVPIDQKRVAEFDLLNQSPAEVCLKALALWRAGVQAGSVAAGQTPIVSQPTNVTTTTTISTPPPGDWRLLTNINNPSDGKPAEILFPDGEQVTLSTWTSLTTEVARWLASQRLLSASHCPIRQGQRAKRYIVNAEPIHSDGKRFNSPRSLANNLYIEANYSAVSHVNNTIAIINHVGQDPAQFKVRFD